jgi:hypothetical protein
VRRFKERFVMWVVWHLPSVLVYWATIRLMTTVNLNHPDDMRASDYLKAYGDKYAI